MESLKNYDIHKLLFFYLKRERPSQRGFRMKVHFLKMFILTIFIKRFCLEYKYGNNKILYVDRFVNLRNDWRHMIDNLMATFGGKCDRLIWKRSRKVSFNRMIRNIYTCCQLISLKKEYNLIEWISALYVLLEIKDVEDEFDRKIEIMKYNLVFCYFDADPFQNFMIQYSKKHGCKTATLQHGVILSPRAEISNNPDFCGYEFEGFVSDYFLLWNDFTKREAIKYGIESQKLLVLGVAKCIGMSSIKYSKDNKTIGVFLDGIFEEHNNIPLIQITQDWAKKNNYTCLFRYHPDYKTTEHLNYLDLSVSEICPKTNTIYEFIEKTAFCVVANSTVLFELEYFCIPFIRFSSNDNLDKYRDYPSFSFTSEDDFDDAYHRMITSEKKKFVSADDNYASFFKKFVN